MNQFLLPFGVASNYAPEDFIAAPSNAAARSWLATPESWSQGRLILSGDAGCGKTHLLNIWANDNNACLLGGRTLISMPPSGRPLAIDDADQAPEETLLHALNQAGEAKNPVLLTMRLPPARKIFALPDLASRLRASEAVEICPPEDVLLESLLSRLAAERQLMLGADVRKYLLTHLPRTAAALRHAVAQLDHAALAGNRKINRALAATLLTAPSAGEEIT